MDRVKSIIAQAPTSAKAVSALAVLSYLVAGLLIPSLGKMIAMIPVNTVGSRFHFWNILTAPYFERGLISLLIRVAIVLVTGRHIAVIWSERMTVLFLLFVNLGAYLCTFVTTVLLYQVTFYEPLISSMYCGLGGYVAGLSVVAKQQIPEYAFYIGMGDAVEIRGKWIPFVLFVWTLVWSVVSGSATELPLVVYGIVVSWVYLRFYQRKEDGSIGDRGASLAFKTLFPSYFHPMVDRIELLVTRMLERIGVIRTQGPSSSTDDNSMATGTAGGGHILPVVNPEATRPVVSEDERQKRRELASRVLEEYMSKGSSGSSSGSDGSNSAAGSGSGGGDAGGDIAGTIQKLKPDE